MPHIACLFTPDMGGRHEEEFYRIMKLLLYSAKVLHDKCCTELIEGQQEVGATTTLTVTDQAGHLVTQVANTEVTTEAWSTEIVYYQALGQMEEHTSKSYRKFRNATGPPPHILPGAHALYIHVMETKGEDPMIGTPTPHPTLNGYYSVEYTKHGRTEHTPLAGGGAKATLNIAATCLLDMEVIAGINAYDITTLPAYTMIAYEDIEVIYSPADLDTTLAKHAGSLQNVYLDTEFNGLKLVAFQLAFRDTAGDRHNIFAHPAAVTSKMFKALMEGEQVTKHLFHGEGDVKVLAANGINLRRETYIDWKGQPTSKQEVTMKLPYYTAQRSLQYLVASKLRQHLTHDQQLHKGFAKHQLGAEFSRLQIREATQDATILRDIHEWMTNPTFEVIRELGSPAHITTGPFTITIDTSQRREELTTIAYYDTRLDTIFNQDTLKNPGQDPCDYVRVDTEDDRVYQATDEGLCSPQMRFKRIRKQVQFVMSDNGDIEVWSDIEDCVDEVLYHRTRCSCTVTHEWPRCTACHQHGGRQEGFCECYKHYADHQDDCETTYITHLQTQMQAHGYEYDDNLSLEEAARNFIASQKRRYEEKVHRRTHRDNQRNCLCLLRDNHANCTSSAPISEDESADVVGTPN